MMESIRFIDRYGMKIWISVLFGGITVAVLLLIPHVFMALLLGSEWTSILAQGKGWLESPDSWRQAAIEAYAIVRNGGTTLLGYGLLVFFVTLFSFSFFVSGLMGVIRQAAVEQQASLGHFYSFGFRYCFRMIALAILQIGLLALVLAGMWFSWPFVPGEWYWQAAYVAVGTSLLLVLATAFCHMSVIMFTEEMGAFRSFGYGFSAIFRRFGSTLVSFVSACFAGFCGAALLTFLSAFPWLILQFFDDSAITTIVSVACGSLLVLVLGAFPFILSLAVLFQRYLSHIQPELFPEDHEDAWMFQPLTPDDEEVAVTREVIDQRS
jgi:hypothetical protein